MLRGQIKDTGVFRPEALDSDAIDILPEGIRAYGVDVVRKDIAA
jgi:hypothetical protein